MVMQGCELLFEVKLKYSLSDFRKVQKAENIPRP